MGTESYLKSKIKDLDLTIKGELEEALSLLYKELETHNFPFKPEYYFTDEWGCPCSVPIIGIPFYLGNSQLRHLHNILEEESIGKILRHEAGHCFNYAYRLYETDEWIQLFGDFREPYKETWFFDPTSLDYVLYLPHFYAQRHADEDFAETFAVWLDPNSNWQQTYLNQPIALSKLNYINQLSKTIFLTNPINLSNQRDLDAGSIDQTVEDFLAFKMVHSR